NAPLRYRHTRHGGYSPHRPQPTRQRSQIIDAQVEQRATPGFIEPIRPVRAGPAVAATRGDYSSNVARLQAAGNGLKRWAQNGEWRAEQVPPIRLCQRNEFAGLIELHG